ncbi:citrate/2-methylcitrate synthase [Staphylococcus aureus]
MAELQRGLEGVIAAETKISSIIESQLTYAGYDIDDLAENAQFEEVIFLLWNYRLPERRRACSSKREIKSIHDIKILVCIHILRSLYRSRASNDSITYVIIIYFTFRS